MVRENIEINNDILIEGSEVINVLAVEDDAFSMKFLELQIKGLGHNVYKAENGQKALQILDLHKDKIDVVLMDREMPVMDGLTAVRRMKDNQALRNIPVIMVTGADSVAEMRQGMDAGVFYYLTKPVVEDMLRSVLSAAVKEAQQTKILSRELKKHKASFNLIETCRFKFRTLSEAESLAAFIANCFPEPERVISGIGALLVNAIEHGNLEIGYDKKTQLIDNGTWRSEIDRTQKLSHFCDKYAVATVAHKQDGVYVIVEDQGQGFDWQQYMRIDPARAGDNHGRGIALAKATAFDRLAYNRKGNKAVAFVGNTPQLKW